MYSLISIYLWGGFVYSQCFFPDGTPTEDVYEQDGYYPCNSTTGGQASSCCQLTTSACTTEGYCIGNNGYAYRGACTDSSFPMPCPQYCLNIDPSSFSTFFPCAPEGRKADYFCCGFNSPDPNFVNPSCCNETFLVINYGNPFVPLSYAEAHEPALSSTTSLSSLSTAIVNAPTFHTLVSSSSSASTTISNTPTISPPSANPTTSSPINQSSSSSSSSPHSIAIGAGVGVPLGVALLLSLGFLLYHEHKQRLKLESLLRDNLPRGRHEEALQARAMDGVPHELGGYYNNELGGNPIHEANEGSIRRT